MRGPKLKILDPSSKASGSTCYQDKGSICMYWGRASVLRSVEARRVYLHMHLGKVPITRKVIYTHIIHYNNTKTLLLHIYST